LLPRRAPICNEQRLCEYDQSCEADADCASGDGQTYVCVTANARCTPLVCRVDADCPDGHGCDTTYEQGQCYDACVTVEDCDPSQEGTVSCNESTGRCEIAYYPLNPEGLRYCTDESDCIGYYAGYDYCAPTGICSQCRDNADCAGSEGGPWCNVDYGVCTCLSDEDCGALRACGF
jgi:hypothetical protein